jgi:hypothetical protein
MNTEQFLSIYNLSRNGCDHYIRIPLTGLTITDGVKDLADTGCWWLMDIIGTEVKSALKRDPQGSQGALGEIEVMVKGNKAVITMSTDDDAGPVHTRKVDYTDMPAGTWKFFIQYDGTETILILTSEY